jgi:hypothetical protein
LTGFFHFVYYFLDCYPLSFSYSVFCHSFHPGEHSVDDGVDDAAVDVGLVEAGAFDDCDGGEEASVHAGDWGGEKHSDGVDGEEGDVVEAAGCGVGSQTHVDDVVVVADGDGDDVDGARGDDEEPLVERAAVAGDDVGVVGGGGDDCDAVAVVDGEEAVAAGVDDDGAVGGDSDDVPWEVDCLFGCEALSLLCWNQDQSEPSKAVDDDVAEAGSVGLSQLKPDLLLLDSQ